MATEIFNEYYCAKCNEKVRESDEDCPKCKAFLVSNGAVKIKKVKVEHKEEKEKPFYEMLEEPCEKILSHTSLAGYIGVKVRKKFKEINKRIAKEDKKNIKNE